MYRPTHFWTCVRNCTSIKRPWYFTQTLQIQPESLTMEPPVSW